MKNLEREREHTIITWGNMPRLSFTSANAREESLFPLVPPLRACFCFSPFIRPERFDFSIYR